ncbi:MAG TPA: glycoside hydrolase family 15 protein [Xanthobacteraceae bacterium]|nr:glycoside hydrolase family 15 protein [Xanthobacteraceae bacterium]
MPLPIEQYAMIGDCETAALVGRDGSIDWLCWPRFDSSACFAALLGNYENGRWQIAPRAEAARVSRRYRPDTLVLETHFETKEGSATLVDFMPQRGARSHLIRQVVGVRGHVRFATELVIRFGYGEIVPWVTRTPDGLRAVAGPDMIRLRTSVPLHGENFKTVGAFEVAPGETKSFVMSYGPSHLADPESVEPAELLHGTEQFWRDWISKAEVEIFGPWADAVRRSLITLKALTYGPTGGLVAAPTTSLPERLAGARNWDYRFCWLRDATMTLLALMNTGYYDEARAWRDWLLRAVAGTPAQMQIMYGIAGERRLTETELSWLPGYEGAVPVRIGNDAHRQSQLDVYGELLDALHQARERGLAPSDFGWALQGVVLDHLEKMWRQPDRGIWESRGAPQHFTYSKVMVWVAFDRAVKSAEMFGLKGPLRRWRDLRREIHADICRNAYDEGLGSFVQAYGSKLLDASLLLIPAVGFLPAHDPRVVGTVAAIERSLMRDGFVMRYDDSLTDDGLPPGEGAFLACSFWLADAYILLGRYEEARRLFDRLVGLVNDVGLLSEEYDVRRKRFLGNFPQAFSHLALVNTACNFGHYKRPAEQRAEHPAAVV